MNYCKIIKLLYHVYLYSSFKYLQNLVKYININKYLDKYILKNIFILKIIINLNMNMKNKQKKKLVK